MKAIVYVIICLSFCTHLIQCSCLSYGHSCWGGHGKRASTGLAKNRAEMDPQSPPNLWTLLRSMRNSNDDVHRRESKLHIPLDDSMDPRSDQTARNDLMDRRNIPVFMLRSMDEREHERAVPSAFNNLFRNHKLIDSDAVPTPNPDTAYDTTPYPIYQSDDLYEPRNNRFYKVLVE